jgi:predicted DNA-binding transcriptional regulator YafY
VRVKRGPGGGYRIDTRRQLPPLELTPGEVSALVASLVAVGPYISAAAQSALGKLLAALAPPSGDAPPCVGARAPGRRGN